MKFVANKRGFVALRNSPEVIAELERRAQRIAQAAGEGMETRPPETHHGIRGRARVAVVTATFQAMHREATGRALTRALGGGG